MKLIDMQHSVTQDTVTHYCLMGKKSKECFEYLLQFHPDLTLRNVEGLTAIDVGTYSHDDEQVLGLLRAHRHEVNVEGDPFS